MNIGLANFITIAPNQDSLSKKNIADTGFTRDYYKGRSFVFSGKWEKNKHYFCDEFLQDWVSFENLILICKKSHLSSEIPEIKKDEHGNPIGINSEYWDLVFLSNMQNHNFMFIQDEPKETWTIPHNLNTWPSVTTVNTSGEEIKGDITFQNSNNIVIEFSEPISGRAFLN